MGKRGEQAESASSSVTSVLLVWVNERSEKAYEEMGFGIITGCFKGTHSLEMLRVL